MSNKSQMRKRNQAAARPRLSLCLITRDETGFIEGCINSVADVVDQIVVVDSGSEDDTREKARALGAEVYEFPWNDSYADARNESLAHATGDWILMLDADGEFDEPSKPRLREILAANDRTKTYGGKARSYFSNGEVADSMFRMLWPNRAGYRFVGRVHEQLVDADGDDKFTTVGTQLVMHHYGYLKDVWEAKNKAERYRKLLELELESRPDDFMTRFHAAAHYLTIQNYEDALEQFQWCVNQLEAGNVPGTVNDEWMSLALGDMAAASIKLGRYSQAREFGERAVQAQDGMGASWYWLGLARAHTGDLDAGIEAMTRARALGDRDSQSVLFTNRSMSTWLAEHALGEMHFLKGEYDSGIRHLNQGVDLNPTNADGWLLAAMAYAAKGDFDSALERFGVGSAIAEPGERAAQAYASLRQVADELDTMEVMLRSLQETWDQSISVRRWLLDILEARLALAESVGLEEEGRVGDARIAANRVVTAWPALAPAREVLDRLDSAAFAK